MKTKSYNKRYEVIKLNRDYLYPETLGTYSTLQQAKKAIREGFNRHQAPLSHYTIRVTLTHRFV